MRRVVVTGCGTVNPLGLTVRESWENCCNGVSGVGRITLFDTTQYLVKIACEVKNFDPSRYMEPAEARRRDRCQQFSTAAAKEAIAHSGLAATEASAGRIAVMISSAIGGLISLETAAHVTKDPGPRRVNPFTIPMLMPNGPSGLVAIDHGFKGPAFSVASACASSSDGIGTAWQMIRAGIADAAIAGGTEATICSVGIAAFDRLGALSRRTDDYSMTPQPFDKNRDGLVMGEGAAALVLEELEFAQRRGANILAELAGYAATADSFHITAPHATGVGGAAAMSQALESAGLNLEQVDYINAHGTATLLNDLAETRAINAAFGAHAQRIPVSSTKSMTGHMMGATGALEAIFCIQAIREGVVPPTMHYAERDPECNLDYVPNAARQQPVAVTLSNSFGFGGHNSVLVFKRFG